MESDDRIRSKHGLAICLRDMGDGTSRIFMDDVKSATPQAETQWSYESFYTFMPEINNEDLKEMRLSGKDYANIGAAVVARLLALNSLDK